MSRSHRAYRVTAERTGQTGTVTVDAHYIIVSVGEPVWESVVGEPLKALLARLSPANIEEQQKIGQDHRRCPDQRLPCPAR